jgi:hypothetical protein
MLFVGIDRAYGPFKTLQCCDGASSLEQRSVLRGIVHSINPTPKHILLLGGLSPINPMCQQARLALEWDSRGPFPPAAIMVGLVVVSSCTDPDGVDRNPAYHISLELSCK